MNTNLSTNYVAIQTDRSRLSAQAERGWQAEQATASRTRWPVATVTRRWAGTALVVVGERLQGVPRGVKAQAT